MKILICIHGVNIKEIMMSKEPDKIIEELFIHFVPKFQERK